MESGLIIALKFCGFEDSVITVRQPDTSTVLFYIFRNIPLQDTYSLYVYILDEVLGPCIYRFFVFKFANEKSEVRKMKNEFVFRFSFS